MLRPLFMAAVLAASLSACNQAGGQTPADKAASTALPTLRIAPEDVITAQARPLASGPVMTGSIQPERKADLRAEVSAVVLQVLKDNGDLVRRGEVLARLDPTAIQDGLRSAQDNARNAALSLDQAERNLQRLKTLRASGMTSLQALDDAEVRRNSATSELSASQARAAQARQQLERTLVRAPFDGVVSERKVSAGDTAAIGKELLKVIDPTSMRFAGRVSADKIGVVAIGQPVSFRINGYAGQAFRGKVIRVDPSANEVTRQVEVLVSFLDATQPRVSGLYAEGTIESASAQALTLPESVLLRAGDKSSVWLIKAGALHQAELSLGARDPRTGDHEVRTGLAAGDIVLRNPSTSFRQGQAVDMLAAKPPLTPASGAVLALEK